MKVHLTTSHGLKLGWLISTTVLLCHVMSGCYYDNEETLYPDGCDTNGVSYVDNVIPILQANCLTCHDAISQNGNVNLEGYDNVKFYVDNGRLVGAINHDDGFEAMPQGTSQLSKCSIDKIQSWVDTGAPDN